MARKQGESLLMLEATQDSTLSFAANPRCGSQAITELRVAMQLWLETTKESGLPIPEPRFRATVDAAE